MSHRTVLHYATGGTRRRRFVRAALLAGAVFVAIAICEMAKYRFERLVFLRHRRLLMEECVRHLGVAGHEIYSVNPPSKLPATDAVSGDYRPTGISDGLAAWRELSNWPYSMLFVGDMLAQDGKHNLVVAAIDRRVGAGMPGRDESLVLLFQPCQIALSNNGRLSQSLPTTQLNLFFREGDEVEIFEAVCDGDHRSASFVIEDVDARRRETIRFSMESGGYMNFTSGGSLTTKRIIQSQYVLDLSPPAPIPPAPTTKEMGDN